MTKQPAGTIGRMGAVSIAVVVPVFNNPGGLRRTLVALAAHLEEQPDLELVVVDDGSTDETAAVIEELVVRFPRHQVLRSVNRGAGAARNTGAAHATADHLVFLDANDEPAAGWLTCFTEQLGRGSALAHCRPVVADPAHRRANSGHWLPGCFAISHELFDAIHGYDVALRFGENTDLVSRARRRGQQTGLTMTASEDALLVIHDVSDPRRYDVHRVEAMAHLMQRDRELLRRDRRRWQRLAAVAAVSAARTCQGRRARGFAWTAVRARPIDPRNWSRLVITFLPAVAARRWSTLRRPDE